MPPSNPTLIAMNRLDQELVTRQLFDSRARAQRAIKSKLVKVLSPKGWETPAKPSFPCDPDWPIELEAHAEDRYVSRAGLKLEGAIDACNIDFKGCRVLDIGCSTGGFSDCALKQGAAIVVGVDVGHDQLHRTLLDNPSMHLYEGVNARNLPDDLIRVHAPDGFDRVVMDVSFISQSLILPEIARNLKPDGLLISLVKPQFEVGKEHIAKGGIVKDSTQFELVKQRLTEQSNTLGMAVEYYGPSPIKGGDGNHEFLMVARRLP